MTFTEQLEKLKADQALKILSAIPEYTARLVSLGFKEAKKEIWDEGRDFVRFIRKPYKNITQVVFISPSRQRVINQEGYFGYHFTENKDPYGMDTKEFDTFEELLKYLDSTTPTLKPKRWEVNIVKSGVYTSKYSLDRQLRELIPKNVEVVTTDIDDSQ